MPENPPEETVEVQWVYTPADFFEEKIVWESGVCPIEIERGHIAARMSVVFF
jgi:hypothetical protein